MLASALETMSLHEIGPQLKLPNVHVGGYGYGTVVISFLRLHIFFSFTHCVNHARIN